MSSCTYRRAIAVLDRRGWHQGALVDETTGAVCILGACVLADGAVPDDPTVQDLVNTSVRRHAGLLASLIDPSRGSRGLSATADVTEWNDKPFRTEDDVRDLLTAAAAIAEAIDAATSEPATAEELAAIPHVLGDLAGATTMTETSPVLPASERTHVAGVPPIVVRRPSLLLRLVRALGGRR